MPLSYSIKHALKIVGPMFKQQVDITEIIDKLTFFDPDEMERCSRPNSTFAEKHREFFALLDLPKRNDSDFHFFLEILKENSSYGHFFNEFKKNLPNDSVDFRTQLNTVLRKGGIEELPPYHIPRPQLSQEIIKHFEKLSKSKSCILVHGPPGCGKTTVVNEALHNEMFLKYFTGGVIKLTMIPKMLPVDMSVLYRKLYVFLELARLRSENNLSQKVSESELSDNEVQQRIINLLNDMSLPPTLIFLDDVWESKQLKTFISMGASLLITSRESELVKHFPVEKVQVPNKMQPMEAQKLFMKCLGRPDSKLLPPIGENILKLVDYNPLTISMLGNVNSLKSAANASNSNDSRFLLELQRYESRLMKKDFDVTDSGDSSYPHESFSKAVGLSIDGLPEEYANYLNYLCIFEDNAAISSEMMHILWNLPDEYEAADILREFSSKSLLRKEWSEGRQCDLYSIHRTVSLVLTKRLTSNQLKNLYKSYIERFELHCKKMWHQLRISDPYVWWYLAKHMRQAGISLDDIKQLYTDMRFLNAKIRVTGCFDVIQDVKKYANHSELSKFIQRHGHLLMALPHRDPLDFSQSQCNSPRLRSRSSSLDQIDFSPRDRAFTLDNVKANLLVLQLHKIHSIPGICLPTNGNNNEMPTNQSSPHYYWWELIQLALCEPRGSALFKLALEVLLKDSLHNLLWDNNNLHLRPRNYPSYWMWLNCDPSKKDPCLLCHQLIQDHLLDKNTDSGAAEDDTITFLAVDFSSKLKPMAMVCTNFGIVYYFPCESISLTKNESVESPLPSAAFPLKAFDEEKIVSAYFDEHYQKLFLASTQKIKVFGLTNSNKPPTSPNKKFPIYDKLEGEFSLSTGEELSSMIVLPKEDSFGGERFLIYFTLVNGLFYQISFIKNENKWQFNRTSQRKLLYNENGRKDTRGVKMIWKSYLPELMLMSLYDDTLCVVNDQLNIQKSTRFEDNQHSRVNCAVLIYLKPYNRQSYLSNHSLLTVGGGGGGPSFDRLDIDDDVAGEQAENSDDEQIFDPHEIVVGWGNKLRIYDMELQTPKELQLTQTNLGDFQAIDVSDDDSLLVAITCNNFILIWSLINIRRWNDMTNYLVYSTECWNLVGVSVLLMNNSDHNIIVCSKDGKLAQYEVPNNIHLDNEPAVEPEPEFAFPAAASDIVNATSEEVDLAAETRDCRHSVEIVNLREKNMGEILDLSSHSHANCTGQLNSCILFQKVSSINSDNDTYLMIGYNCNCFVNNRNDGQGKMFSLDFFLINPIPPSNDLSTAIPQFPSVRHFISLELNSLNVHSFVGSNDSTNVQDNSLKIKYSIIDEHNHVVVAFENGLIITLQVELNITNDPITSTLNIDREKIRCIYINGCLPLSLFLGPAVTSFGNNNSTTVNLLVGKSDGSISFFALNFTLPEPVAYIIDGGWPATPWCIDNMFAVNVTQSAQSSPMIAAQVETTITTITPEQQSLSLLLNRSDHHVVVNHNQQISILCVCSKKGRIGKLTFIPSDTNFQSPRVKGLGQYAPFRDFDYLYPAHKQHLLLISACFEDSIKIWDYNSPKFLGKYSCPEGAICCRLRKAKTSSSLSSTSTATTIVAFALLVDSEHSIQLLQVNKTIMKDIGRPTTRGSYRKGKQTQQQQQRLPFQIEALLTVKVPISAYFQPTQGTSDIKHCLTWSTSGQFLLLPSNESVFYFLDLANLLKDDHEKEKESKVDEKLQGKEALDEKDHDFALTQYHHHHLYEKKSEEVNKFLDVFNEMHVSQGNNPPIYFDLHENSFDNANSSKPSSPLVGKFFIQGGSLLKEAHWLNDSLVLAIDNNYNFYCLQRV